MTVLEDFTESQRGLSVVREVVIVLASVASFLRGAEEIGVGGRLECLVFRYRLTYAYTSTKLEGVPESLDEAEIISQRHLFSVVLVYDVI